MRLLYITANPKKTKDSKSLQVGDLFLNEYKKNNPEDIIEVIDLYKENFKDINYETIEAIEKNNQNKPLTDLEQEIIAERKKVLDQFLKADKIVFVTPMWEFSTPAAVKVYLDIIAIPKVVFKYTKKGPIGLIKNKKILHIQSSGGDYSKFVKLYAKLVGIKAMKKLRNFGNEHLEGLFYFFGIRDYTHLLIPRQSLPKFADKMFQKGLKKAISLAKKF